MAKRKRLTPAQPAYFNANERAPEVKSMPGPLPGSDLGAPPTIAPPIAQVASDAATRAALDEVTGALRDARAQGRMIEALPVAAINARYLMRDRILNEDDEDMDALMASLRARGQQTPIEVIALPDVKSGAKYGLISGWRRLSALDRLYKETGEDRFATIKALVVTPDSAQDAYVAMVEENEIRVNLSLYERARIALHAAGEGVFPTPRHAVLALFEATPRPKRSKISSFIALVQALDGVLMFPKAIPEKPGLELAKALDADPGLKRKLRDRLTFENPQTTADEMRILMDEVRLSRAAPATGPQTDPVTDSGKGSVARPDPSGPSVPPAPVDEVAPGLQVRFEPGALPRIELSGAHVDDALYRALKIWLGTRADK